MDIEQVMKQLEWLDEERRKDKTVIATLEKRLSAVEGRTPGLEQQIREMGSELARISASLARFDQIEAAIAQIRVEFARSLEEIEKTRADHEREMEKVRRADMESLNKAIGEVRRGLDPIPDLKKGLQSRTEEDFRLGRLISEVEQKVVESRRSDEEYRRTLRMLEENNSQYAKRLTDMQGEVTSFRKRLDEQRGKVDLNVESLRKVELRLSELQSAEGERRQAQIAFLEKQSLSQVERERVWKEWQTRFEIIEKQAVNIDSQLQMLDSTHRAVKRSQEAFDDITQRFERRINEITEMQRLVEDRFRQEWVSFKADDQKRWTNYTLAQEEQQREGSRQFDRLMERLVVLEDLSQELQDVLHQVTEETQKRLQAQLAMAHDLMEEYEKVFGRSR